jgi:hypothetical protein
MSIAKSVVHSFCHKAEGQPERLPWHRESPSRVLVSAVAACARRARSRPRVRCGRAHAVVGREGLEVTGLQIRNEVGHYRVGEWRH